MINTSSVRTILFITLSNLGDIILTTPVLERLHDEFPEARIDVITGEAGTEIFEAHPAVRSVETRGKKRGFAERLAELAELRRRRYDLVVDLRNSLIPYLAGARYHTAISPSKSPSTHKIKEHLAKLSGMGLEVPPGWRFFIPATDEDRKFAEETAPNEGESVIINPGAKSHLKRWDAAKYALLADRIVSELGRKVFLAGNADDSDVVAHVKSRMKQRAEDLCGRTSLGALAELARRAGLIITNDSAPLHVASAVGTPTIAIFGPSDEKRYGPLADRSVVFTPSVSCRPCGKALCALGIVEGCISHVEVDEVFNAAKRILNG